MKKNNSLVLVIVIAILGFILFIFLPDIYKWTVKLSMPKVKDTTVNQDKSAKEKTFDEKVLNDIVYPNMHVNMYKKDTYYSLKQFTINQMSNNDILANAFEQVYDGYIVDGTSVGCTTIGKKVSASYLNARIKNMLNENLKYQFTDFEVYNTKYPGIWKYDNGSNSYIYNGNCNNNGAVKYYDIHSMVKYIASKDNKKLEIIAKVAFVKVENNTYIIYKDANMTQELNKGTFTDLDTLSKKLKSLSANQYKYTFKQGLCTYSAYCLEKGEWLNG